jgi:hypothetical protein
MGLLEPHGGYGGCDGQADLSGHKYSFYEKVVVLRCDDFPEYVGGAGYVLGRGDETSAPFSYGVLLDATDRVCCFNEDELQGTGEIAPRTQFYDDNVPPVRVRVIDGKGYLADD